MKNIRKTFIVLISMSMILVMLLSCTPTNEPFNEPIDDSENNPSDVNRPNVSFDTEEEFTTFLDNLTKNAEDLSEYDAADYYKDTYFGSYIVRGTEFVLAPGFCRTPEQLRQFYDKIKGLGYPTVENKLSVQKYKFKQFISMDPNKTISSISLTIDDIGYLIKVLDRKDTPMEIKPEYKLVKKTKFCENEINLYKNTSEDWAWIFGSVNIGELTVSVTIFVDNKEEIDKINLEQFVWKDYYEEEVNFDD